MTSPSHTEPDYMKVFWWLLVLTVAEVGIVYSHISRIRLVAILILTALMKALLVAINYMHLKFERWQLIVIAVFPVALVLILLAGLLPDIGKLAF